MNTLIVSPVSEIKDLIYKPTKTFKEYVNYNVKSDCLGFKYITLDSSKIDEYCQNCIKEIAEKYEVSINLIKLINSQIIIPNEDLNNTLIVKFEKIEIKNSILITLIANNKDNYSVVVLNKQINDIIKFCNELVNKYTIDQLTKRKSNGSLSFKVEKIIYENYDVINSLKIMESNYNQYGLKQKNINEFILKQIDKEALYCFNFVLYVHSLSSDEFNKIKERVELRLKEEEETFNKKTELIMQAKINEVSLNYDRIIRNIIGQCEKQITELKDNGHKASVELLAILEEKFKMEHKINELEEKIKELEEDKNDQIQDTDYKFLKDLIKRTSMSE
jgi:hypothetical protein